MKKLNYLIGLFLIAALSLGFVGCDGVEDEEKPDITVSPTTTDATVGTVVTFNVSMDSNAKLQTLTVEYDPYDDPTTIDLGGEYSVDETIEYTVPASMVVGTAATLTFTVEDKDATNSATATVNVVSGSGPIATYSAKLMGADLNADYGSFMDAHSGTVYMVGDAFDNQADVDFVYYHGSTNGATMAAPNESGAAEFNVYNLDAWTTKNATKFTTTSLSATDFNDIENDATILEVASDPSNDKANQLSQGDVIGFKTEDGKMGVFLVSNIVPERDGYIEIDVKIQE